MLPTCASQLTQMSPAPGLPDLGNGQLLENVHSMFSENLRNSLICPVIEAIASKRLGTTILSSMRPDSRKSGSNIDDVT